MFDLVHLNNLYFVSQALRSQMNRRIIKCSWNFCEKVFLNLIDFTVRKSDMVSFKKPRILQETKKLHDAVLLYENDGDVYSSLNIEDDYDASSEDSDTGELIGFRKM